MADPPAARQWIDHPESRQLLAEVTWARLGKENGEVQNCNLRRDRSTTRCSMFKMCYALRGAYRQNAWIVGPQELSAIAQFKDSQNRFLFESAPSEGVPGMCSATPCI